jgi:hypothetical protein
MSDDTKKTAVIPGIGLDIGTMNLVSARRGDKGITTKRMRDVFLDLPTSAKKMLKLSATSFVEREDDVLILGDAALELANVFGQEARRPLSAGIVSATESESLDVLGLLIKEVLGPPAVPDEVCYYSVPAEPIDQPDRDIIYHREVFRRIVTECGYKPFPANEGMGIIFAETAKEGFSGVALSFGSGMTNVALAINTIEGLIFSVARGGDWIDRGAAKSVGATQARACAAKEKGIDLTKPQDRLEEAIAHYYRAHIDYVLDQIGLRFKSIEGKFDLPRAIPVIVSGGTSLAGGFMEFFTKVFNERRKRFPIEVSEIRQAGEPLNAVAHGLLIQAMQEHEED